MRLTCEANINFQKAGLPVRKLGATTLCIRANIRDPKLYNLVISTKKQTEFACFKNIRTNIVKLFTTCVKEGKLTISFREPTQDLLIRKAAVPQLEKFLSILRAIEKGEEISKRFLKEAKMEEPPPRSMKISERSQYPVRGFPATLEKLTINHIKLSRLQRNIIDLNNLVDLNLDDNALKTIPAEISSMRLKRLSLAHNELTELRDIFLGTLGQTIKELNLSRNRIRRLSYTIVRPKFRELDLSHNDLTELPVFFRGGDELAILRLEGNNIGLIPSSFLAKNARVSMEKTQSTGNNVNLTGVSRCPTLVELSCVRLHSKWPVAQLPLEKVLPRTLHAYLLAFVRCRVCGKFTFPSPDRRSFSVVEYLEVMNSVVLVGDGSHLGTRVDYLCSGVCCARYKHAYRNVIEV